MLTASVAERTVDRRRELLDAAIAVFARRGYHGSRVGDIAREAGVAHGLLYHYFRSKEEVLATIVRETWHVLDGETQKIEAMGPPLREQLRRFAHVYLGSWVSAPDLIRVLVREVGRSPEVGNRIDELGNVFLGLERMIEAARKRGEVRADCDAELAALIVYGALEEILTGWVLGQLPAGEGDVGRAVDEVVDVAQAGLAA
jgi:TetR/AcrR family transcriptional regulator, fatty acid metabolism regulator protein